MTEHRAPYLGEHVPDTLQHLIETLERAMPGDDPPHTKLARLVERLRELERRLEQRTAEVMQMRERWEQRR